MAADLRLRDERAGCHSRRWRRGDVSVFAAIEGTAERHAFRLDYHAASASAAGRHARSAPPPDRYPLSRSELEDELIVAFPGLQGP